MTVCGVVRVGLLAAFIAAAWLADRSGRASPKPDHPFPPSEPAKASAPKASAPRKEAGAAVSPYTAGLVTGPPHSTEFAITQDIATTLASGQETGPRGEVALRVMPMVGNGGVRNIMDVLTLAGADMAIAPVVLVDRLRETRTVPDIQSKLVYIAPLFVEEFHLLARPRSEAWRILQGKTVNLGEEGSAAAVLGREVLNRLEVKFSELNLGLDAALDGMRKGQIFASLLVSGKPVNALARYAQMDGIHLLPIPYSRTLQQDYLPSKIRREDYPSIVGTGESVDTIAIKSALFAYNWPSRSERFQLLEFFVETLFVRFPEFLGDAHHPKWREVNLPEVLPGWRRFRPAERWLQRQSGGEAALRNAFDRFLRGEINQQSAEPRRVVPGIFAVARTQAGQVSKHWEISMRNALVTAALVASLGLIADMRQLVAQFALPEGTPRSTHSLNPGQPVGPSTLPGTPRQPLAQTAPQTEALAPVSRPASKSAEDCRKERIQAGQRSGELPKVLSWPWYRLCQTETLPLGPFLCFDRKDRLVATVYMVPTRDIDDHKLLEAPGFAGTALDHVSIYFNPGHPGWTRRTTIS